MHHDFRDFLRHGGNGEYTIHQRSGLTFGYRLSGKSQRPGDDRQRQAFRERLETVAAKNARMILSALTPPDTVPLHSESDLLPASDLIEKVLQVWDDRLADIQSRYRNHPQRIRPLRANMEERTALAFAGMINQLRQKDLGIERYIWVTQGDHKVRSAHAALNGEVFDWDHPSEEGHPGQAPNCRCRAVPVPKDGSDIVLANYTALPEAIGDGGSSAIRAGIAAIGRLLGVSPVAAGSFLTAVLWATPAGDPRAEAIFLERLAAQQDASRDLGLEMQDPAAFMAALAYVLVVENVFGFAVTSEESRIAGQAAALYELAAPGTIDRFQNDDPEARSALRGFVLDAVQAYRDGRLRLTADGWAQGWTEVFPELTEEERRLAELPGFTAEQQEAFILADPLLNDGLPAHTGHAPEGDPTGNVISTPITEEEYAQILARARNEPGVASGAGKQVGADWLREGIRTGAMPIPASVAERLDGRRFGSFDAYRRAFWKAVAEEPELMGQFNSFAQDRIRKGLSPRAPDEGHAGKRRRWEMDHIEPLWRDGGLYDSENLQIMTPMSHIEKTREDMKDYRQ